MEMQREEQLLLDSAGESTQLTRHVNQRNRFAIIAGCVTLILAGYIVGSQQASSSSIRSDALVGKTGIPNTEEQFKALYQQVTSGQTEAGIAAINVKVLGGGAGAVTGDLKLLKDWYAAGTSSNKAFAQGILMDTLDDPAVRVATPPTASSFSSYAEFGQEYSRQTAGKPWSTIVTIDASVREVSLPSSASPAVQQLHHWYQHHATAEEKHDFDTGAVEHEQMGVR